MLIFIQMYNVYIFQISWSATKNVHYTLSHQPLLDPPKTFIARLLWKRLISTNSGALCKSLFAQDGLLKT